MGWKDTHATHTDRLQIGRVVIETALVHVLGRGTRKIGISGDKDERSVRIDEGAESGKRGRKRSVEGKEEGGRDESR